MESAVDLCAIGSLASARALPCDHVSREWSAADLRSSVAYDRAQVGGATDLVHSGHIGNILYRRLVSLSSRVMPQLIWRAFSK